VMTLTQHNEKAIIKEALRILKRGGIIAYPTESFYALGVDATDEKAVKRLFTLKRRSYKKPIPVIVGEIALLRSIVTEIPSHAQPLIERYWPGPLTLVFEAAETIPLILTGKGHTIAVRIPGEGFSLHLAKAADFPITSTSANPSSLPPAKDAEEVERYFHDAVDLIVDGGETPGGLPSTIVDVTCKSPMIIREGRLRVEGV